MRLAHERCVIFSCSKRHSSQRETRKFSFFARPSISTVLLRPATTCDPSVCGDAQERNGGAGGLTLGLLSKEERVQCTSCASADLSQSSVKLCAEPSGLIPSSRMQMHIDETTFCGRCYTRRLAMSVVERKMVLSLSMDEGRCLIA